MTRHVVPHRAAKVAGFSLIEVLVSMLIVSMGILALAGLLQVAARYGRMSELRSTATLLANDLADRVRANPAGARAGAGGYDFTPAAFPSAPLAAPSACTRVAPCAPAALARADLAAWTARLHTTLPGGSAWVRYGAGSGAAVSMVDVWVAWTDPNSLTAAPAGDRSGTECPTAWGAVAPAVRCLHLAVGL